MRASKANVKKWVEKITSWYRDVQRPLPWRETKDAYRIWISESMLQQTQVVTVIPYYHRFLDKFPTIESLAAAEESDVLRLWSGLGYYSRARNLHRGAKAVVEKWKGEFPRDRKHAESIPGVGPYTAGAVLSIAYGLPEPLVDGNVQRVFARFFGFKEEIHTRSASDFFWSTAREWVGSARSPSELNQALMELGATLCSKAQPRCTLCPLKSDCIALKTGTQASLPRRKPRRPVRRLSWATWVHESDHRILLQRNAENTWWEGLWDFPRSEKPENVEPEAWLRDLPHAPLAALDTQKHTVTHHRIEVFPYVLPWKGKRRNGPHQQWVTVEEAKQLPLSALAKKILLAYCRAQSGTRRSNA
jgi:A/G-specific adenine glycosylase